ncbi:MAG: Rieske 2Fe-2S domain-containing protein [Gemmatimonadetes bacterium]|nr:Rieske 2Fe-2S domain-containing protein [Gemmatimonadota bacterium]
MLPSSSDHVCTGCARVDRRQFLTSASILSLGALATACGDGVISGPADRPPFPSTPFTLVPANVPALQSVGGRVVVTNGVESPVLVERVSTSQFRALSLVCPHQGTIVGVDGAGFRCPNHEARFAGDGRWLGGQPTADLSALNVQVNADGSITVGGAPLPPTLSLSTAAAVLTTALGGAASATQAVAISNAGGSVLTGLQVALAYRANQPGGWLAVSLDQSTAPATLTLTAQRGALTAGSYGATVTVSATGSTNGAQTIDVVLVVQDPAAAPSLQLGTAAVSLAANAGGTAPSQTVPVTNAGGGTLSGLAATVAYAPGGFGWLTATLDRSTAPATLTVRANPSVVTTGTYTATVTVSATGVASRTITVTLTITNAGLQVTLAAWPALANVGGVVGSVGNVGGVPVAVARTGPDSFLAFSMRCTHAGTILNIVGNSFFRCPNHGAEFTAQGIWRSSPQRTENLDRFTVTYTPGAPTLTVS